MAGHDLDVDSPDKVPGVLRDAAQAYYESEGELQGAWQDPGAGSEWGPLARILERAADEADSVLAGDPGEWAGEDEETDTEEEEEEEEED